MQKERLVAFSDGVFAIIITIMVLELKVPHGAQLTDLQPLAPTFFSYIVSYINVGIYWNNHHHMLHVSRVVSGAVMWANLYLLFMLSLIPFSTAWLGQSQFAAIPMAFYGVNLFLSALGYVFLQQAIIGTEKQGSLLAKAIGSDFKGKLSLAIYLFAIIISLSFRWVAFGLIILVAIIWLIPDKRIERTVQTHSKNQQKGDGD